VVLFSRQRRSVVHRDGRPGSIGPGPGPGELEVSRPRPRLRPRRGGGVHAFWAAGHFLGWAEMA
jgi:hypothetical protein